MKHFFYIILPLLSSLLWADAQSDTEIIKQEHREPVPDVPSFTLVNDGEKLTCSPLKLIQKSTHKNVIEFICFNSALSADLAGHKVNAASLSKSDLSAISDFDNKDGRHETQEMSIDANVKKSLGAVYKVKIPQDRASQPKAAARIAKRELNKHYYAKYARWILPAKLYTSIRPQMANSGDGNGTKFQDGGSRAGFFYYYSFKNGYNLTFQYEAKIKWDGSSKFINLSAQSDSSRRLSFISLQKDNITVLYGKYWSAYYDLAGYTNGFMAFGGSASGAYNNGGDGGASGTGRAYRMLQVHIDKELYSSSLQYQLPHKDKGKSYSYGLAGSLVYNKWDYVNAGASVAFAKFEEIDAQMHSLGIEGDDISYITGFNYEKDKILANGVISYTQNHMNDDQGNYFDGVGVELTLQYQFNESIRLACGGNWLIPTDSNYQGEYSIETLIFSAQYAYGDKDFKNLVYTEVSIPNGELANGDPQKIGIAVGLRYYFDTL
jgi:hypothetical protein